jgi:hypothetical protein
VVGLEDFEQLGLGNDTVALLIKGHKGKLEFVFLARARVIGNTDEKLKGRRKSEGEEKGVRREPEGKREKSSTSQRTSLASICPVLS